MAHSNRQCGHRFMRRPGRTRHAGALEDGGAGGSCSAWEAVNSRFLTGSGDVVLLDAGSIVPADMRLIKRQLKVGKWRSPKSCPAKACRGSVARLALADRINMAFKRPLCRTAGCWRCCVTMRRFRKIASMGEERERPPEASRSIRS
jgi:hypothetical protein